MEASGERIWQRFSGLWEGDAAHCEAGVLAPNVVVERLEAIRHRRGQRDAKAALFEEAMMEK